jgi:glycopeptide antibiotics resistance protein
MAVAFALMVAFAALLARATLEPSYASKGIAHSNVHPGASLRQYFQQYTVMGALRQVGGNLLLGVPFGVLLPVLAPKARGVFRVLLTTAVVMLLVELVQGAIVPGRAFDIDDVILNTTGALLGYVLLGRWLGRKVHRVPEAPVEAPAKASAKAPAKAPAKARVKQRPLADRVKDRFRRGRQPARQRP